MSKRQDLAAQIKQLEQKQMEVLRLKYGDGLNYKQIAEKLSLTPAQVGLTLFETLKKLEADGAASFSEEERSKILWFIHGELDATELQSMATRIEGEESLRKEFESWLAVSDDIESLLAKPSKPPPGAPPPKSYSKVWIGASLVLAVGVALPLLKRGEKPRHAPVEGLEAPAEPVARAAANTDSAPFGTEAPAQLASEMGNAPVAPTAASASSGEGNSKKMAPVATKGKAPKNIIAKKSKLAKPTKKIRAKSPSRPKTSSL